jgi:hypothetical protein
MSDSRIRVCNFLNLRTADNTRHRYQNYFINEQITFKGERFDFIPFRAEGSVSSLNGENQSLRILLPAQPVIITLVEAGNGNRLSTLTLTTAWLDARGAVQTSIDDFFSGTGASFSDETVELRFRSAMDSVSTSFPARTLTQENVGILPLNSDLTLR